MNAKTLGTSLAAGRVLAGAAFLADPERVLGGWVGSRTARRGGAQLIGRALGVRDLVLGLGALTAGSDSVRPWYLAGALSDAVDLAATVTADDIPESGRWGISAIATAALLVGAACLADRDVGH